MIESIEFLGHNLIIDQDIYLFIQNKNNINIQYIRDNFEHLFLVCSKCNQYVQIDMYDIIKSNGYSDYNLTCDEQIIKNILE